MWRRSAALGTLKVAATAMKAFMCRKSMAGGFYTKSVWPNLKAVLDSSPAEERAYPASESRVAASRRVAHAWFQAGSARNRVDRERTNGGVCPSNAVGPCAGYMGSRPPGRDRRGVESRSDRKS